MSVDGNRTGVGEPRSDPARGAHEIPASNNVAATHDDTARRDVEREPVIEW
jgi:hypothetical protein